MTARACLNLFVLLTLFSAARAEPSIEERARSHWAFRPVARPAVPEVRDRNWPLTPIDAFLLTRLEKAGLKPSPRADQRTLLRRAYLDIIGLPPAPEDVEAFVRDTSPDAWERVVDRLLSDPRYGERWGRHWLDVARYADTNGYERDGDKPFAWRYRDYVIDTFNADLGYDHFIREQIAGDELPHSTATTQIATTFLRLGTWDDEPANDVIDRYDQLDDVLGVTTSAFLAQTIRCARCHDHKFEPISQKEYYGLLAVFMPLKRPQQGRTDLPRHVGTYAELSAFERSRSDLTAIVAQTEEVTRRIRERVFADETLWPAEIRLAFSTPPSKRTAQQNLLVGRNQKRFDLAIKQTASTREWDKLESLKRRLVELESRKVLELPQAYVWHEDSPKAPPTHLLRRGSPSLVGKEVEVGLPSVLSPKQPNSPTPLERTTGRRLWLANWIASGDNPLTARVMANRVWQWHFGTGLVRTPGDFGLAGDAPSHPELLDWLASELVSSGWSLKHLHCLILTSSAYQCSSALDEDGVRKLSLFGRWRQRRLEAEALRDSILYVSGQLNTERYGPGVYPALPQAVLATQSRPGLGWGKSDVTQSSRRSIYVFSKRSLVPPELELLDIPDSTSPCEQRPLSTTAPQALTFLNGTFANEQAMHFADRLLRERSDAAGRVRRAYELALNRQPTRDEIARILTFLARQSRQIRDEVGCGEAEASRKALASFCLVLLNTSEFFYPG